MPSNRGQILAALIVAATLVFLFRYELSPGSNIGAVLRLNRITGTTTMCQLDSANREYRCP